MRTEPPQAPPEEIYENQAILIASLIESEKGRLDTPQSDSSRYTHDGVIAFLR
jgi:hypothetical protein